MTELLKELYKSVILKHNNEPYHFEKKESANHQIDAYNPLCGDRFTLFLTIENQIIKEIYFHGYGCAISKASTSVLAKLMEGKNLTEAAALFQEFQTLIQSEDNALVSNKEELNAFVAVREFPGRLSCVLLSWEALDNQLY